MLWKYNDNNEGADASVELYDMNLYYRSSY